MSKATQIRGICQCCGREQAVVNGTMSKHGYTVEQGWFSGVCTGQHYAPMQISRDHADSVIVSVRAECITLLGYVEALRTGKVTPLTAKSGKKIEEAGKPNWQWKDEMVAFALAPAHHQRDAVQAAAWNAQRRAEIGKSFADDLERLADEYHGKPLKEVAREDGPAPIRSGEKRKGNTMLTCTSVEGARVYWVNERGYKGWTGSQAWRRMALV